MGLLSPFELSDWLELCRAFMLQGVMLVGIPDIAILLLAQATRIPFRLALDFFWQKIF
jgi:hypothetical protein